MKFVNSFDIASTTVLLLAANFHHSSALNQHLSSFQQTITNLKGLNYQHLVDSALKTFFKKEGNSVIINYQPYISGLFSWDSNSFKVQNGSFGNSDGMLNYEVDLNWANEFYLTWKFDGLTKAIPGVAIPEHLRDVIFTDVGKFEVIPKDIIGFKFDRTTTVGITTINQKITNRLVNAKDTQKKAYATFKFVLKSDDDFGVDNFHKELLKIVPAGQMNLDVKS